MGSFNYKDKRWEKKRSAILKRDKYFCMQCRRYGKAVEANTVHHIYPAEFYPEYRWSDFNLISLCSSCHDKMHVRDTHELSDLGQKLKERTMIPPSFLQK